MSWLPVGTSLGELEITEVFVDYDGPRVFACRSLTDQRYVAAWADEGDDRDLWLYTPISDARLDMVASGGIPLRSAFTAPEGFTYLVTLLHERRGPDEITSLVPASIQEDWLPEESFRLNNEIQTAHEAKSPLEIQRLAEQERRPRLDMRLHLPSYTRTEAPTKKIGEVLISVQALLENLGLAEEKDPPQSGRMPDDVYREMASNVVELSAASFVIGIAPTEGVDLLGDSRFSRALKTMTDLLDVQVSRENLIDQLSALRPRGAKSFQRFVEKLSSTGGDLALIAGSPSFLTPLVKTLTSAHLENLGKLLKEVLPDEVRTVRGRMQLEKVDMPSRKFGLKDLSDGRKFPGLITERAYSQVDRATINAIYDVVLIETEKVSNSLGSKTWAYSLEQLVPAPAEDPVETTFTDVELGNI